MSSTTLRILFLGAILLVERTGQASAEDLSVYFVSVGSTHYASPRHSGEYGFPDIPGADRSAYLVATLLLRAGATYGILLTSARGQFVGLHDIGRALSRIEDVLAKRPASAHPLLVFYFAGHGISEGVAWSHFSVPGDLVFRDAESRLPADGLATRALYASSLVQQLDGYQIPYVVLLDTCYYAHRTDFHSPVLSGLATRNLEDVAKGLRFLNEFRQSNPVIFASAPGTEVATVPDPTAPRSDAIAPLARRLVLAFGHSPPRGGKLTLAELIADLRSEAFDTETKPAVSYARPAPYWADGLGSSRRAGVLESMTGSIRAPAVCCDDSAMPPDVRMWGQIVLQSGAGEPLMGQSRRIVMKHGTSADLIQRSAGAVEISFGGTGGDWEIDFSGEGTGRLEPGRYPNAQEYGFAGSHHAALSVSGAGVACNDSRGEFYIRSVAYDSSARLTRLLMSLIQFCDGSSVPLTGEVDLHSRG